MNRRWRTNVIVLVAVFLIFTAGYFIPRGDNLTAIAMWVLLLAASICVAVIRMAGSNQGRKLLRLDAWRRRFWRFALDEDDEPATPRPAQNRFSSK